MPLDRYLVHWNTEHFSEEQNFDVENPSCQVLTWEDLLSSFSGKKLKSTLSVADVTDTKHTKGCMETVHQQVPEEGAL